MPNELKKLPDGKNGKKTRIVKVIIIDLSNEELIFLSLFKQKKNRLK